MSDIRQIIGPCPAKDRWWDHIRHKTEERTMSYIKQIRGPCQASVHIQLKMSGQRHFLPTRARSIQLYDFIFRVLCSDRHVYELKTLMHIDKRQSFISIRATHLYMEKHITSWMTLNRGSPYGIHCHSSCRYNSWFIQGTFSSYNIRSFSYSNDLSCNHVENHVILPVVVNGDKFWQFLRSQYVHLISCHLSLVVLTQVTLHFQIEWMNGSLDSIHY